MIEKIDFSVKNDTINIHIPLKEYNLFKDLKIKEIVKKVYESYERIEI